MKREIVIGTRDSALAVWQTNWVREQLERLWPDDTFSVVSLKTKGDKILDVALAKIGDKGLFTRELDQAMLDMEIDLAVHSMKDVPTKVPEGLIIGAVCERENPGDVILSPHGYTLAKLPLGAKVGTSSLRRRAQLMHHRPDLVIEDLRGNVNTRLMKMERDGFDAIILAAAGVIRMGWQEKITEYMDYALSLPAVGQGSIGIQCREGDEEVLRMVKALENPAARDAIVAERSFLRKLEGGCQIPIGALGRIDGDLLTLEGLVASLDGGEMLRDQVSGPRGDAEQLGEALAEKLIGRGANRILAAISR